MKRIILNTLQKTISSSAFLSKLLSKFSPINYGYTPRQTSSENIQSFINLLTPVRTEHPLIRVGPDADGGYLLPDDLNGITHCFSPGVGNSSSFELDLANRGLEIFMADKSVDGPKEAHPRFNFIPKFLGAYSDDQYISLEEWLNNSLVNPTDDLILQMDIEGAEHEVILSTPLNILNQFRIIVMELHFLDHLWSEPYYQIVRKSIEKITLNHTCVHIHPNNYTGITDHNGINIPRVIEITLLRNDRFNEKERATEFPHPLDFDNVDNSPPLPLPQNWYE